MLPPLLIAFSHLRWGSVYQRPQQLLSRLSGRWRVLYVEEPVQDCGGAWLEEQWLDKHLTLLVPRTPLARSGFHDDQHALVLKQLAGFLGRTGQRVDVAWLYTPMALPLAEALRPLCMVYDCIDDATAFADAPKPLREREAALLERADLVLTDGPSLYEARRGQRADVVCLPSSVDAAHYAAERLQARSAPASRVLELQDRLPHPRLGFFGAIDQRLDTELLARLADAHPEWSLVMVGPVAATVAYALPRRPNIHWLGLQSYAHLPYFLAGWDLCLMPFVLNESTRFISPTKTLEYMAAGKPVVSTPVHDVAWMYSDVVTIAAPGQPFVEACETLLAEDSSARAEREMRMLAMVSATSWDRTAQAVHELLLPLSKDRELETAAGSLLPSSRLHRKGSVGVPLPAAQPRT